MESHKESHETMIYLSRADVESLGVTMRETIDAVEDVLREKGEGRVELPPKPGIHTRPDAFIHAMPAYIERMNAGGIKWVSGYPENPGRGMPYVSGLMVLNNTETGVPVAVMDCTWITAMRTGAATAVAAKYLARQDSATVGIVACGVQGRSNLQALAELFPVRKVLAYDHHVGNAERYAEEMSEKYGIGVEVVTELKQAVKGCDIVVTSGPILKEPAPAIEPGWLEPGAFACPLDFDSYWQGGAMREIDLLATDDTNQMNYYRGNGFFSNTPEPYADLGEIVTGRKPGRQRDEERTMSINLGLAIEDVAVAKLLYDRAVVKGAGTELPL